jgi:hypothetical protein
MLIDVILVVMQNEVHYRHVYMVQEINTGDKRIFTAYGRDIDYIAA